jgi:hypothetical protein
MNLPNPGLGQASWSEAALRVASRRAKFIPPLEAEGFLWLFCKEAILAPTLLLSRFFFFQPQVDAPLKRLRGGLYL